MLHLFFPPPSLTFIHSFMHLFTYQTAPLFWSCAPKAFRHSGRDRSLHRNLPQGARLCWRASEGYGRSKEGGGPCSGGNSEGTKWSSSQDIPELSLK